jgi:hypothetical protein
VTWTFRPGSAAASSSAIRRASHSRDFELVPLITSLAVTGRDPMGSRTMMARMTQLLPYPVFSGPDAEPSWNHEAAQTFLPRLFSKVSSTTASTGCPSGTSSVTTSRAA